MAFKLSKAQLTKRGQLQSELESTGDELTQALSAYNAAKSAMKGFVTETAEAWRNKYDEKSEKWQEGDKASEVNEIIEAWEGVELEEVELQGDDIADALTAVQDLSEGV